MDSAADFLEPYSRQGAALADDSRLVGKGDVFVARRGGTHDGFDHVEEAIAKGAGGVLHEEDSSWNEKWSVPHCGVAGLSANIGAIAARYFGSPSEGMTVVAVTGTKGKSSTSYWCAQLLGSKGPCGYVGTIGKGVTGGKLANTGITTPSAAELQAELARFAGAGCGHAVLEASSHGLEQGRLLGVACDVAVFTNLGVDHLDYHDTPGEYLRAKARLFEIPGLRCAVINADDTASKEVVASTTAGEVTRVGQGDAADLRWSLLRDEGKAAKARLESDGRAMECALPAPGAHNASNLALAAAAAMKAGMAWDEIEAAAGSLRSLPGRMERVKGGDVAAYVDFAHTPEALEAALVSLAEEHPGSRITCVFGCGGNRDRSKRPLMGEVAARLADRVIVTSDNPRDEDPADIAAEVAEGAGGSAETVLDRAKALAAAVREAEAGDVVLAAGKGDETETVGKGGSAVPFSDAKELRKAIGGRGK